MIAAVREADRALEVGRGVGGGAAGVEQDEVDAALDDRGADVVGVGLDREAVGEVRVGDLGLRHAVKLRRAPGRAASGLNDDMRQYLAIMHRVVAFVPPGVAPFELGIVVEVFGLDRPELDVPWWYDLVVAAEPPGPLPATSGGFSFYVEHGLEALDAADTIVVPGWHGDPHRRRSPRSRGRMSAARGWSRSAAGSSSSPPRACSTAERRRRTGATRSGSPPGIRASRSTPTCSTSTRGAC